MSADRFRCVDCGKNTSGGEYYMVPDELWAAAGMAPHGGMLCLACLECRIGRRLTPDDFTAVFPRDWHFHVAAREGAEIVSLAKWRRRPVKCGCRSCQAIARNWHRFGAKQKLADFVAEHALTRDPPSVALELIAMKGRSRLARAQARTILRHIRFERVATPDDGETA